MENLIPSLGRAFLNLIYPLSCHICQAKLTEDNGLCQDCISKIHKNEFGIAACEYEGVLKEALHLFKYKGLLSFLGIFSHLLIEFIDRNIDTKRIDTIIPIPLHPVKLRERGFNQAYLLSRPISKRYNIPISINNLIKVKSTEPQSNLNRSQRLRNLKNAFYVKDAESLRDKRILLVDDVYTTGATINEVSRVLKKAGVSKIEAVTLAKGI